VNYSAQNLDEMDQRFRAQFVNSLSGFKSACLVGTQNHKAQTNLSIISSIFHVGANPPLIGMLIRPHSVRRDTLENIQQTGVYTLNQVNSLIVSHAHQTSARYDANISEFTETGLTPYFSAAIRAPYVAESNLKIGLQLESVQKLEVNQTELVIGRIIEVIVDENAVAQDGYVDIESLDSVAISGLDSYHTTNRLNRFQYAKPHVPVKSI